MRILHTSDWHLGKTLENINRIKEQKEFIDELCSIVERESIDMVLVAGDIFDTYNPSSAAEELFYDAMDRLNNRGKRAVVVIAGNHDNPERLCASSPIAYRNGIILLGYPSSEAGIHKPYSDNISIVDSGAGWMEVNIASCDHNAVIITLPYPSEARLEQVLSEEADEDKLQQAYSDKVGSIFAKLSEKFRDNTINLVASHIFLKGGKESESERTLQVGGAMTVDPAVLPENAHYVALGHLHRPQKVKEARCSAYYSGSPLAYSFSEADYSKALYIIDAVPGKEAEIKEVVLNCGKPLRRWIALNGIEEAIGWCEEAKDHDAWIDLEIHTDRVIALEEQKRLRELNPGIINIRPVIKTETMEALSYENREGRKIDELFSEYYKYKTGTEISDELIGTFLEVLNGEDDEEEEGNEAALS